MEETFQVEREDNCIWLTDLRQEPSVSPIHITPEQAQELIDKLTEVCS